MLELRQRIASSRQLARLRRSVASRTAALVLAAVLAFVVTPVIGAIPAFYDDVPIVSGQPAPRTVVAPSTVRLIDEDATEQARVQASEQVAAVTASDREAQQNAVRRVADLFTAVRQAREPVEQPAPPAPDPPELDEDGEPLPPPPAPRPVPLPADEQVDTLTGQFSWLTPAAARTLVDTTNGRLDVLEAELTGVVRAVALTGFTEAEREATVARVVEEQVTVRPFSDDEARYVVGEVAAAVVQATLTVDTQATEEAREAAAAAVEPIAVTFPAGQPVVTRGSEVSPLAVSALSQLGLLGTNPWQQALRLFAIVVAAVSVSAALLLRRPDVAARPRLVPAAAVWLVVFAVALTGALLARTVSPALVWALPAGAVTLLAANVLSDRSAITLTVPMAALTIAALPGRADLAAAVMVGGAATVLFVSGFTTRRGMRVASLLASGTYGTIATIASVAIATPSPAPAPYLVFALTTVATLGGLLLGAGMLPFVEATFGILTPAGLLDLEDRNHPLMRRLADEAPGSYNHSVLVSTLARRAANEVGADGQLVAVQAMYHDIGKVCQPHFFVENQLGVGNPHDELPPEVSAEIIQAHVTDGVELARRYRLPSEIVDGIATHHGTSLVAFFYRVAVSRAREDGQPDPDEETFRYPGRKPFTKETAILMLADCVEGASRAAALDHRLTEDEIRGLVGGLVSDRIADGQLADAPLTLADIETVKASFVTSLVGVYHPRIAYPDKPKKRS